LLRPAAGEHPVRVAIHNLFDAAQEKLFVGAAGSTGLQAWNDSKFRAEMLTAADSSFVIAAGAVNSELAHMRSKLPTRVYLTP
jgi:hypothetical protein